MNDPNAPLFFQGNYHIFYQHNPYNDTHGTMYWGHCKSSDLLRFEDLSIALEPREHLQEKGCWSGSGIIPFQGHPTLLYTGHPGNSSTRNMQNLAVSDSNLSHFVKRISDVLPLPPFHIDDDWRDPFFFRAEGKTFVVIAASREGHGTLLLYEAIDLALHQFRYVSELFSFEAGSMRFPECPNFVKIEDKWVLLVSPYRSIEYWIGTFDLSNARFIPEHHGILDTDSGNENGLYASNILCTEEFCRHPLLIAWLRGYPAGYGWCGALSLPRVLELGGEKKNHLIQRPWPEITSLRRDEFRLDLHKESAHVYSSLNFELEIHFDCKAEDQGCYGTIDLGIAPKAVYQIIFREHGLQPGREELIPYQLCSRLRTARIFRDGMTLEIFINDGEQVVSRSLDPAFDQGIIHCTPDAGFSAVLWHLAL
ncbi:glycoside hydrolase family 32 protein [Spirochaeta dissipatitropha]